MPFCYVGNGRLSDKKNKLKHLHWVRMIRNEFPKFQTCFCWLKLIWSYERPKISWSDTQLLPTIFFFKLTQIVASRNLLCSLRLQIKLRIWLGYLVCCVECDYCESTSSLNYILLNSLPLVTWWVFFYIR